MKRRFAVLAPLLALTASSPAYAAPDKPVGQPAEPPPVSCVVSAEEPAVDPLTGRLGVLQTIACTNRFGVVEIFEEFDAD